MSGHSKWASIKHKKGALDAKRGKLFNRHARLIEVAARAGGGDININVRLRAEVQAAKSANMPNDKIDKAVAKGAGLIAGVTYEEAVYEAYGPEGVALMIDTLTDNKNRTVGELRNILVKHNGHLGEGGSVAWNFTQKGVITVPVEGNEEDAVLEIVLEAGAEDLTTEGDSFEITTAPKDFAAVRNALNAANVVITHAEVTRIPGTTVQLGEDVARKVLKLMDVLDDQDDVQNVSANFDISDEVLEVLRDEG
jgi:YebC/PmpR family DNA-binding regulatory protein